MKKGEGGFPNNPGFLPVLRANPLPWKSVQLARVSLKSRVSVPDFFSLLWRITLRFFSKAVSQNPEQKACVWGYTTLVSLLGNTLVDDSRVGQTLTHTLHSNEGLACKTVMMVWLQLPGISVHSMWAVSPSEASSLQEHLFWAAVRLHVGREGRIESALHPHRLTYFKTRSTSVC